MMTCGVCGDLIGQSSRLRPEIYVGLLVVLARESPEARAALLALAEARGLPTPVPRVAAG